MSSHILKVKSRHQRAYTVALNVQVLVSENKMLGEKIASPRLVNVQTLSFDNFCDYLSQGSTVTAADVSAVMKQLEKNLPLILGLNSKVIVSPDGLTFRPAVKGSITQSQLKAKLTARKEALLAAGDTAGAAKIDTERELTPSDLAMSDLTARIVIDIPVKWDDRFKQQATFKRITRGTVVVESDMAGSEEDETNPGGNVSAEVAQYTLSVSSANSTQGTVNESVNKAYDKGTQVVITATPASGYTFSRWSDGSTANPRTLTIDKNYSLTAEFNVVTSGGSDEYGDSAY